MFTLYPDTEKELFYDTDYKPLPCLDNLQSIDIISLLENLYIAIDNAFSYHSELLTMALYDDIISLQKYRMELYIKTISSGHIASVINNNKYIEIDKALMAAMKHLSKRYTEDSYFFDIGTDPGNMISLS